MKNEPKKPATPPARVRKGTKLGLDAEDRRNDAANIVHRTDGRRRDFAPGERIPKVGYVPLMLPRPPRELTMAVQATNQRPDDFWARVEQTPIMPGPFGTVLFG